MKVTQQTDAVLMPAAEVWFLRAEAALRGWTDESAKTCYEEGVMASFRQYGILQSDAYLESDLLPADFVDTYDMENDITARFQSFATLAGVSGSGSKLEKIITQKWIAMFPEGCEAWAEQRRTGYPGYSPYALITVKTGA